MWLNWSIWVDTESDAIAEAWSDKKEEEKYVFNMKTLKIWCWCWSINWYQWSYSDDDAVVWSSDDKKKKKEEEKKEGLVDKAAVLNRPPRWLWQNFFLKFSSTFIHNLFSVVHRPGFDKNSFANFFQL